MTPQILHEQLRTIIEADFAKGNTSHYDAAHFERDEALSLSSEEMFRFWNVLGEELGIDLSLASGEQREMLLRACSGDSGLKPKSFGALLWLVYYSRKPILC